LQEHPGALEHARNFRTLLPFHEEFAFGTEPVILG
jgi:hypothetical protein